MINKIYVIIALLFIFITGCRADDRFVLIDIPTNEKGSMINEMTFPDHPYYISKNKVTVLEWKEYLATTKQEFNWDFYLDENNIKEVKDDYPITSLTWIDAIMFCNWKSDKENKRPVYVFVKKYLPFSWAYSTEETIPSVTIDKMANGYRLPTEVEWEFASMGGAIGANTDWWETVEPLSIGWFHENTNKLQRIAQLQKNPIGLYDVIGDSFEWIWTEPEALQDKLITNNESTLYICKGGAYYMSVVEPPSYQKGNKLVHEDNVPSFFLYRRINAPLKRMAGIRLCFSK